MPKYLCVIEPNPEGGFDGYAVDLGVFVVGKDTREEVIESLQEGLALARGSSARGKDRRR